MSSMAELVWSKSLPMKLELCWSQFQLQGLTFFRLSLYWNGVILKSLPRPPKTPLHFRFVKFISIIFFQWSLGYLWPTGGLASDVIRREQNSYSGYPSSSEITIRVGSISKSMYIVDTIDSNLAVRKVYLNETIAWIASIATQLMLKSEEIDSQEQNIFLGLQLRVISYFLKI